MRHATIILILLLSASFCVEMVAEEDLSPRYNVVREPGGVATTSPFIPIESIGSIATTYMSSMEPATGDFNGDGRIDYCLPQFLEDYAADGETVVGVKSLAIVAFGDGAGGISESAGTNGFASIEGVMPGILAVGDLDEDGCSDILSTRFVDREVDSSVVHSIWFGSNDAVFERVDLPSLSVSTQWIETADVNKDERLDVLSFVLSPEKKMQLWFLAGNGAGGFSEPVRSSPEVQLTPLRGTIRVGDMDGDSFLDVVFVALEITEPGGLYLYIAYGDEYGEFEFRRQSALSYYPRGMSIDDINGDGLDDVCVISDLELTKVDAVSGGETTAAVITRARVFHGSESKEMQLAQSFDLNAHALFVYTERLDTDQHEDMLFITDQGLGLVMYGSPEGLSPPPLAYSAANGSHSRCRFGGLEDVNGDSILDFYVQLYDQELVVRFGNERGGFGTGWMSPPISTTLPTYTTRLAGPAVFDRDGNLDLVFYKGKGAGIAYGNGRGGFDDMSLLMEEFGWSAAGVGDFNGDGLSDLLLGQEVPEENRYLVLLINQGNRTFQRASTSAISAHFEGSSYGEKINHLLVGDLNSDQVDDVVVCEGTETYVLLGSLGDGGLVRAETIWVQPERLTPALERRKGIGLFTPQLYDINMDGKLDLVGVDSGSEPIRTIVWLGDGTGGFTDVASYPYRILFGRASDLNHDGFPDILAWSTEPGYAVLLGGSEGNLVPRELDIEPWMGISASMVGDIDEDGKVDFVQALGMVLWIYLGEGEGKRGARLQFAPNFRGDFSYDVSTIAADYDNDGRLNIALTSDSSISVVLNHFFARVEQE